MTIKGGPPIAPKPIAVGKDIEGKAAEGQQADQAAKTDDAKKSDKATQSEAEHVASSDVFESSGSRQTQLKSSKSTTEALRELKETLGEVDGRPSGLNDLVGVLHKRNEQLQIEFDDFQKKSHNLVDELASQGFSPHALDASRPALNELRSQMSAVRATLRKNKRLLKFMQSAAFQAPSFDPNQLKAHWGKLKKHPIGWQRNLALVGMGGELASKMPNGSGLMRLALRGGATIDSHALGVYLSEIAPQSMLSRFAVQLMEGGKKAQAPIDDELKGLHRDIRRGRAGKELEELAKFAESGE